MSRKLLQLFQPSLQLYFICLILFALASALFMKGDYEGCIEHCNTVLRKQPSFGPAWNNLSLAQFEKGEFARAVECADKALESGYDVPEAYLRDLAAYR